MVGWAAVANHEANHKGSLCYGICEYKEMEKLDAKIDGLTHALLHTNQRDKIAAETENRELRKEIERLKGHAVSSRKH